MVVGRVVQIMSLFSACVDGYRRRFADWVQYAPNFRCLEMNHVRR
jgi:hypothetical protein